MLDVAPALEHERPQPFLGQLLGCPAAADSRADDDRVVGLLGCSGSLDEHGRKDTTRAGWVRTGGEEGIRTPGGLSTSTVFKTAALNHSATSPADDSIASRGTGASGAAGPRNRASRSFFHTHSYTVRPRRRPRPPSTAAIH